jgi:RND family efflux transporter MFP subunit
MLARVRSAVVRNRGVSLVKRHKRIAVVVALIFVILLLIFRPKAPIPLETTTVAKHKIVSSLTASGTVQAENSVNLSFLTGGKVTYVGVAEGDEVHKGQTIASLDQRSAERSLETALKEYAKQRNTFEETKDEHQLQASDTVRRVLENNQYDLDKAVASVELQEIAKQNAVLTSPIDGIVIRADITNPGVNATATTTYTIADPESLLFNIDVDEADIGRVRLGQSVRITLEAYPEQTIYGTVENIAFASHKTDTGGNAFTVKVLLPVNTDYSYRIGMNGDAEIVLAQKNSVVTVPLSAIIDDTYVYVKQPDGKYEKRQVRLGLQSDTEAEIISGLKTGETVTLQPEEAEKRIKK